MQGLFLVITITVLAANFFMDLVYGFIDRGRARMSDPQNTAGLLTVEDAPMTAPASTVSLATQRGGRKRRILPSTSPKFIVGSLLVLAIVLFAIIAPFFTQNPRSTANPALQPPSAEHWLGTTKLGNDMFAQLAIGAQGSLMVGLIASVIRDRAVARLRCPRPDTSAAGVKTDSPSSPT